MNKKAARWLRVGQVLFYVIAVMAVLVWLAEPLIWLQLPDRMEDAQVERFANGSIVTLAVAAMACGAAAALSVLLEPPDSSAKPEQDDYTGARIIPLHPRQGDRD